MCSVQLMNMYLDTLEPPTPPQKWCTTFRNQKLLQSAHIYAKYENQYKIWNERTVLLVQILPWDFGLKDETIYRHLLILVSKALSASGSDERVHQLLSRINKWKSGSDINGNYHPKMSTKRDHFQRKFHLPTSNHWFSGDMLVCEGVYHPFPS